MLCTAWGFDHNFKFCDDKGCTCKLDLERLVRKIKLKIKLKKKSQIVKEQPGTYMQDDIEDSLFLFYVLILK